VYAEITEAGLHGARAPGNRVYPGSEETTICSQTTRTVTAAFTSSLRQMEIHVSWGHYSGYNGDYCLSDYLSQCYPDINPYGPPLSTANRKFVATSWSAIFTAVSRTMVAAPATDVSRFERISLSDGIRSRLGKFRKTGENADTNLILLVDKIVGQERD